MTKILSRDLLTKSAPKIAFPRNFRFADHVREVGQQANGHRIYEFVGTDTFGSEWQTRQQFEINAGRDVEPLLYLPIYDVVNDANLPKNVGVQRMGPGGTPLVRLVSASFPRTPLPVLSSIPIIGPAVFNQDALTYLLYILIPLAWFYLFRTQAGIHLRAVGGNPHAADALGVNVAAVRYGCVLGGGVAAGLGGAYLSLAYTQIWVDQMTAGRGWVALAMVIFGTWNPLRTALGAYLFGGVQATQLRLQAIGIAVPTYLLLMAPYVFTILALTLASRARTGRFGAPAALGTPYIRDA